MSTSILGTWKVWWYEETSSSHMHTLFLWFGPPCLLSNDTSPIQSEGFGSSSCGLAIFFLVILVKIWEDWAYESSLVKAWSFLTYQFDESNSGKKTQSFGRVVDQVVGTSVWFLMIYWQDMLAVCIWLFFGRNLGGTRRNCPIPKLPTVKKQFLIKHFPYYW